MNTFCRFIILCVLVTSPLLSVEVLEHSQVTNNYITLKQLRFVAPATWTSVTSNSPSVRIWAPAHQESAPSSGASNDDWDRYLEQLPQRSRYALAVTPVTDDKLATYTERLRHSWSVLTTHELPPAEIVQGLDCQWHRFDLIVPFLGRNILQTHLVTLHRGHAYALSISGPQREILAAYALQSMVFTVE